MGDLTSNFSFTEPFVNDAVDADLWGDLLNANWAALDTLLAWVTSVKTTSFSVLSTQFNTRYLVDTSSGTVTASLPTGVFNGFTVGFIVTDDTNSLIIDPDGTETIDGNLTLTITTGTIIVYDGSNWFSQTIAVTAASEDDAGILEVATTAEAQALTADDKIITPLKLGDVTASTTSIGLAEFAIESEMENETSGLIVTPDQVKNSPGVDKAWIVFEATGPISILNDYNISSLMENATGDFTINFGTNFANVNYSYGGFAESTSGQPTNFITRPNGGTKTTGSMQIVGATRTDDGGTFDLPEFAVNFQGDQ